MNLDERLDRLTARHEALTQTVEIIAGMQQKNEARIGEIREFINRLAHIADAH